MEQVNAIDLSKGRWGMVWDFDKEEARKRFIVLTYKNGVCSAITDVENDKELMQIEYVYTNNWKNYELLPIEKPIEYRDSTIDEIVEGITWRKNEPGFGWGFVNNHAEVIYFSNVVTGEDADDTESFFWFLLSPGQKLSEAKREPFKREAK